MHNRSFNFGSVNKNPPRRGALRSVVGVGLSTLKRDDRFSQNGLVIWSGLSVQVHTGLTD